MAFQNVVVSANAKTISIRGKYGEVLKEVKPGDVISVDLTDKIYSWTNKEYCKVEKPDGWIFRGAIGEVLHGKHFSK